MIEKPIYPLKDMRITQHYNGGNNHYKHSGGKPADYPIDDGGKDGGRNAIYAPCVMQVVKVYGVGSSGVNTIWLTSVNKVQMPCGTVDYLTIMIEHCPDSTLKVLGVGQIIKCKQLIGYEGKDGAVANHIHMSCGRGVISATGWTKNNKGAWVLTTTGGAYYPHNALWLDKQFTTVLNSGGIPWKSLNERGDFMAKDWKNGSTTEGVYGSVADCKAKKNKTDTLLARTVATCVAIVDSCYLIVYTVGGTKKCGFVAYPGGVK